VPESGLRGMPRSSRVNSTPLPSARLRARFAAMQVGDHAYDVESQPEVRRVGALRTSVDGARRARWTHAHERIEQSLLHRWRQQRTAVGDPHFGAVGAGAQRQADPAVFRGEAARIVEQLV